MKKRYQKFNFEEKFDGTEFFANFDNIKNDNDKISFLKKYLTKDFYEDESEIRKLVAELISSKFDIKIAPEGYSNDTKIMFYRKKFKDTWLGDEPTKKHGKEIEKFLKTINKNLKLEINNMGRGVIKFK